MIAWSAIHRRTMLGLTLVTLVTVAYGCERDAGATRVVGQPRMQVLHPVEVSRLPISLNQVYRQSGRAFVQDNLWTDGSFQYAVIVASNGAPIVAKRRLGTSNWSTFDLATIPGNPLGTPTSRDPHNIYVHAYPLCSAAGFSVRLVISR